MRAFLSFIQRVIPANFGPAKAGGEKPSAPSQTAISDRNPAIKGPPWTGGRLFIGGRSPLPSAKFPGGGTHAGARRSYLYCGTRRHHRSARSQAIRLYDLP